ncbi:MAG: hypothetical protein HYS20_02970 [Rhodocyclales bacterium]|nr:hypothetical protein [Rhodocyclales bacterium]
MSPATPPSLGAAGRMVVVTLAGALSVLCVMVVWLGWVQWQRYDAALDTAAPRIARMQGIAVAHQEIATALEGTRAILSRYAYPPEVEAVRAASDFQARVRDVLQAAGLNIVGSQQFPARAGAGFEEIGLSLSLQGTLAQLRIGMIALRTIAPSVRVDQMRLQPVDSRAGQDKPVAQQLNVQTRLIVFRIPKS